MTKIFQIQAVRPKYTISPKKVRGYVMNALENQGRIGEGYFRQTVEHWEGQPKFTHKYKYAGGDFILRIYAVDDGAGTINLAGDLVTNVQKWKWLDKGTRQRYAKMSKDWQSKTKVPGSLGTNTPGQGYPMYLAKLPFVGIQARGWTNLIRKTMKKGFKDAMDEAIRKGTQ